jgi:hypothetical protein
MFLEKPIFAYKTTRCHNPEYHNLNIIPNGYRDRAISLYSSKTVYKKEVLCTVFDSGVYCSGDKFRTVYL